MTSPPFHPQAPDRPGAPRRPPQISLGLMLLMTLVIAAMCAGLYRASQVPAFARDVSISLGWDTPPPETEFGRTLHVYFLLFTYTSPLILAGLLSTLLSIRRWLFRRSLPSPVTSPEGSNWLANSASREVVAMVPPSDAGTPPVASGPSFSRAPTSP